MITMKCTVAVQFVFAASLAGSIARADNACNGAWDVTVGDDRIRVVVDAEEEAFAGTGHLVRLDDDFSVWGFCSTTDGGAGVEWHSDIPTSGGSVYLTFTGLMANFVSISGDARDIEGNKFVFAARKVDAARR